SAGREDLLVDLLGLFMFCRTRLLRRTVAVVPKPCCLRAAVAQSTRSYHSCESHPPRSKRAAQPPTTRHSFPSPSIAQSVIAHTSRVTLLVPKDCVSLRCLRALEQAVCSKSIRSRLPGGQSPSTSHLLPRQTGRCRAVRRS